MTEDELIQIEAYQIALSMIGDRSPIKLHRLLCLLECRDLMRKQRQEEIEARKSGAPAGSRTRNDSDF